MSRRTAAILLVVFATLLLPALCMGGLLDHACACDGLACEHEATCAADPCSPVLRLTQGCDSHLIAQILRVRSTFPSTCGLANAGLDRVSARIVLARWARARATDAPPPWRVLRFHESDLPLRI